MGILDKAFYLDNYLDKMVIPGPGSGSLQPALGPGLGPIGLPGPGPGPYGPMWQAPILCENTYFKYVLWNLPTWILADVKL